MSKASLVASGDQHPPFFWLGACGLDRRIESIFPVAESQGIECLSPNFGSSLVDVIDSVSLVWGWDVCGELVKVELRLGLELVERAFLLSRRYKKRQGKRGDGRETHDGYCIVVF